MSRPNLKILNNKEIKKIKILLKEQYGFEEKLDYVFLQNEKDKIYITNKDISKVNLDNIKINTIGLYFGQLKEGKLRLSIDGSQLIGKYCKKNVAEIDNKKAIDWLKGQDINFDNSFESNIFIILKNGNDFIGCGKYSNGKILNFVSKPRRLNY